MRQIADLALFVSSCHSRAEAASVLSSTSSVELGDPEFTQVLVRPVNPREVLIVILDIQ
jgi:hypothetical protein